MSKPWILMLEHDADDRYITQSFFDENSIDVKIRFVQDEAQMMAELIATDDLPALILMNMVSSPAGAEKVIRDLKSDQQLKHIPVVVLSGSVNPVRSKECYAAGASSVIVKPDSMELTNKKILSFVNYWFNTVELSN
jgi:CheY-like chemotaxis protein